MINRDQIEFLIEQLCAGTAEESFLASRELNQTLGKKLPTFLLTKYRESNKWNARLSCVFHSLRYAPDSNDAYQLGVEALLDKSKPVRYRACMLLAISLNADAIPHLWKLIQSNKSVEDAKAAIDAIKNQNIHYFLDRKHTGKVKIKFNEN